MFLLCQNPYWNCKTESVMWQCVDEDMLCRVWDNIALRWDVCCITRGSHIEHLQTKNMEQFVFQ
jgi:hypothetical protein